MKDTNAYLIKNILECYEKSDNKRFNKPEKRYTEKQLKRMRKRELQLVLAEIVIDQKNIF